MNKDNLDIIERTTPIINVFLLCFNESALLPHTVNHYRKYLPSCKITIYDNESTDNSVEIAKELGCSVISFSTNNKSSILTVTEIKNNCWKSLEKGWIIDADMDEFLCVTEEELVKEENLGTSILRVVGHEMIGESDTVNLTDINLEEIKRYYYSFDESKNLCFLREKIEEINYNYGAHLCDPKGKIVYSSETYVNKHMSFLGLKFLINKYKERYQRSANNRKIGASTHYTANILSIEKLYKDNLNKSRISNNVFYYKDVKPNDINLNADDILVIITTAIHVFTNSVNDVSSKDRMEQAVKQLKTIRTKVPQAKIIILESSYPGKLSEQEVKQLTRNCDYLIRYDFLNQELCTTDYNLMYYCHENFHNKSLGEMFVTIHLYNIIKEKPFRIICKMSGEYFLEDTFNIRDFLVDVPVFSLTGSRPLEMLAFRDLYSIPNSHFQYYLSFLELWFGPTRTEPLEYILTLFVKSLPSFKQTTWNSTDQQPFHNYHVYQHKSSLFQI